MSEPTVVFLESLPQRASGPPLQRAVVGSGTGLAEQYRFLATKLATPATSRATTIGIVSATAGEGKTTVALGLAAALARKCPRRVLLLEADLRQPAIERYLGLPRVEGVSEWLSERCGSLPVRTITPPGFAVISAGRDPLDLPERIGSGQMAALIRECRQRFGFVVVDCPPLDPVADAVELQDLLDGWLLVVRGRRAARDVVQRAVGRLKQGRVQGIVFNEAREILPGSRSYPRHDGRPSRRL